MKLNEHPAVAVAILTMSLTLLVGRRAGATEAAPAAAPAPAVIPLAPPAATLTPPAPPEAAGGSGSSTKPAQLRLHIDAKGSVGLVRDAGDHCTWLDSHQTGWGATAVVTSFLTGTAGLGTIALGDNHTNAKTAVGISSVVLGAFGALSAYLSTHYSSEYKALGCLPAAP
jgi:hypothetical protein